MLDRARFFLLISVILIFSNKFGFIMFSRRDGSVRRIFANERGEQLYGSQQKRNHIFVDMLPSGTIESRDLYRSDNYVVRRIKVLMGNTCQEIEEINVVLRESLAGRESVVKLAFSMYPAS